MRVKRIFCWFLTSVLVLLAGCGPKEPVPVTVTGSVQLNGKPLDTGTITFTAPDGKPPAQGPIVNGAYSLQSLPGERRVEIRRYVDLKDKKGPGGEPLSVDTISTTYNTNSTLKAIVTESGPNVFDFKLEGK
ncbi:MAG: hypothetical protein C0467_02780 [Planctomycetaceae bacterium]|nr:hypothetical protein [Planctomycetaceae bacterium]